MGYMRIYRHGERKRGPLIKYNQRFQPSVIEVYTGCNQKASWDDMPACFYNHAEVIQKESN